MGFVATFVLSTIIYIIVLLQANIAKQQAKHKPKAGELPSDAGVRDLVADGNVQEALDLYRRFTGVDEFTAREAIEDIQREIRLSSIEHAITTRLQDNGKASAIEAYQEATGANLEEALAYVEELEGKR